MTYVVGYVPTGKEKRDWMLDIKTEEQYDAAVASGIGWVIYPELPFSWEKCKECLNNKEKE